MLKWSWGRLHYIWSNFLTLFMSMINNSAAIFFIPFLQISPLPSSRKYSISQFSHPIAAIKIVATILLSNLPCRSHCSKCQALRKLLYLLCRWVIWRPETWRALSKVKFSKGRFFFLPQMFFHYIICVLIHTIKPCSTTPSSWEASLNTCQVFHP